MEESGKGVVDDHDEITDDESEGELPEVVVDVPRDDPSQVPAEVEEWAKSIMKDDEGESSLEKETPSHTAEIQEVPGWLREKQPLGKNWYDPVVVSIGPYHHGKQELQPFEKLKIYFAREYAKQLYVENPIAWLYNKVAAVAVEARKCYAEGSTKKYDDTAFTKMMVLDGCFLLQFIYWHVRGDRDRMKMTSHEIASVERDLFLLENQLPFIVLNALMRLGYRKYLWHGLIDRFIENTIISCTPKQYSSPGKMGKLMEFISRRLRRRLRMEFDDLPRVHILDLAWRKHTESEFAVEGRIIGRYPHRSANDLMKVGIRIRSSETHVLNRITFRSTWAHGTLNLPPIIIDETTITMLLNLVALEHSCVPRLELRVTSYICFLNSIISHANDVKELKYAGIIFNCLDNDEAAERAIHEIADNLVPPQHSRWYVDALEGIESYHRNRGKSRIANWVTEVMRDYVRGDYFRSPWTAIAIIYALLAIVLSFIQTYYTVSRPDK